MFNHSRASFKMSIYLVLTIFLKHIDIRDMLIKVKSI